MILILALLMLFCGGVANAQIVSPMLAPANPGVGATSLPSGAPPQVVGYSAANTGESETVGGDFTFARTGPNAYTATITKINGTAVGALATLNAGTGLTATATTLSLTAPVTVGLGGTGTTTAPTTGGQVLVAQSVSAYGAVTMTGDCSITSAGAITCPKINGVTPGGTCSGGQFVNVISASGVPTCATPAITGVPSGTAPQMVGYTAGGVAESETVSGGAGSCSFTRTGANAYQMVCTTYAPTASPTFTGTVTAATTNVTQLTASTGVTVSAGGTLTGPDGGIWTNSGINDGTIKATTQFTFPDLATYTTAGLNNSKAIGIGQVVGGDPLDITNNQAAATQITILNGNATGTTGLLLENGTNLGNLFLNGSGSSNANTLVLSGGQGVFIVANNSQQIQFHSGATNLGYFATNGFHLVNPLEIASGGTGTATAPTVGQALVATSTSAYAPTTLATTNLSDVSGITAWTPVLYGLTTAGSMTSSNSGIAYRIGRLVYVSFVVYISAIASQPAGQMAISGLPLAVSPTQSQSDACVLTGWTNISLPTNYTFVGLKDGGASSTILQFYVSGNNNSIAALNGPINNGFYVLGSCTYITG